MPFRGNKRPVIKQQTSSIRIRNGDGPNVVRFEQKLSKALRNLPWSFLCKFAPLCVINDSFSLATLNDFKCTTRVEFFPPNRLTFPVTFSMTVRQTLASEHFPFFSSSSALFSVWTALFVLSSSSSNSY